MTSPYDPPRAPIDEESRTSTNVAVNDNPLSGVCPGLLILSVLSSVYEVSQGNVRVTSSIGTIGSVVLFVLYRRTSPYAASFLFWTTLPTYPLYFGLASLGLIDQRPTTLTLVVGAAIWIGALIISWTLRRKYALYIAALSSAVRPRGTA